MDAWQSWRKCSRHIIFVKQCVWFDSFSFTVIILRSYQSYRNACCCNYVEKTVGSGWPIRTLESMAYSLLQRWSKESKTNQRLPCYFPLNTRRTLVSHFKKIIFIIRDKVLVMTIFLMTKCVGVNLIYYEKENQKTERKIWGRWALEVYICVLS